MLISSWQFEYTGAAVDVHATGVSKAWLGDRDKIVETLKIECIYSSYVDIKMSEIEKYKRIVAIMQSSGCFELILHFSYWTVFLLWYGIASFEYENLKKDWVEVD